MDALSAVKPARRVVFMNGVPVGASHGLGYILRGEGGAAWHHLLPHAACRDALERAGEWPAPGAGRADFWRRGGRPGDRGLGLPTRLSEQGITPAEFAGLAARWNGDEPIATNPRAVRGAADLLEILQLAA
jgi:hypothetical protein